MSLLLGDAASAEKRDFLILWCSSEGLSTRQQVTTKNNSVQQGYYIFLTFNNDNILFIYASQTLI